MNFTVAWDVGRNGDKAVAVLWRKENDGTMNVVGVYQTNNEEPYVLDARNTIFCPSFDEARQKVCNQPLGTLSEGERGKQVTTIEGVTVTSREDGGFFLHCPACGGGYFWHQSFAVPVETVAKLLEAAKLMGWQYIKFSGRKPKRVDSLSSV